MDYVMSLKILKILLKLSNILLCSRECFPCTLGLPTTPSLVQAEPELTIFVPQPLGCWDYRWMSSNRLNCRHALSKEAM